MMLFYFAACKSTICNKWIISTKYLRQYQLRITDGLLNFISGIVLLCATFQQNPVSKLLLPVPIVTAIKNEGIKLGIFEQCGRGVGLTHNGKDYVEQALGFKGIDLCLYRRLAESAQARDAYADALSKNTVRHSTNAP